jgi:hypothetical protein
MKLTLKRTEYSPSGIFSELKDELGTIIAHTLEHSYNSKPKVPSGTFTCVRGDHKLHGMTDTFSTFEIPVAGHTDILFHWGNYNKDSEGCVLVGELQSGSMITNSRATFAKLMNLLQGLDTFELEVIA